ncbi:ABC transporter ATP-binding protein uup [Variibacter gotjawalensis]|uniref:ATP-binding protein Uup n=1 Tax=Variibacter gotjawalensis TaxID=1333996 RepID=A0A0S3PZN0_9BRAD|nr:ATP-binding cassette domain-containing protein [Variibacter gotjawalensis]NIK47185.1 ATP-binding cassette subfamily F protein uup [Variibacter gotjawalensis]RZS49085.1 ATP-binding cassette subfamily F protein uup [Variibacter gotjawalensis]BAT61347.1 ABC transporter ATP-binding protein uup [Variibacter gotjawalensis]
MAPPLIQLKDIALTFGGTPLLSGAELSVSEGERVCLVGRNGSGKSTLLKIAAGTVEADKGTRFVQPGATVRYLPQEVDFGDAATTLDYVRQGLGPTDDPYQATYLLEQLGLTGDEPTQNLSGGEARRAAIARALAPDPDILLLDEPTNHLDLTTIEWLESELASRRAALVLISHDRRFLTSLSRATVWLDRGITRRIDRGFGDFEAWRDDVLAEEEREQHKLGRKIVDEEHWLRYGVSGRRKRNVKRLAGLQTLREKRRTYRGSTGSVKLGASEADASGALVLDADHIAKAFGERVIVSDFSTRIQRGDRIGIVGPNGAGKTTLINLLIGTEPPDSGTVRLGANLEVATLDQRRARLDPNATVAEALTGGSSDQVTIGGVRKHVSGYMKDFLFAPEQARTPVHALSGGERGRLMLAQALAQPSNLLVLDEPTNDLDIETLDVLEEMLSDYAGTVLLISHDRDFLDRVVNGVIVPEGSGKWLEYAGGYSDMLTQRGADVRRPAAAKVKTADKAAAPAPSRASPKSKLSFKDKHALETLPKEMDAFRATIAALQSELDDPQLFVKNRKRFDEASAAIAAAHVLLATAEERWLELEIMREELENG